MQTKNTNFELRDVQCKFTYQVGIINVVVGKACIEIGNIGDKRIGYDSLNTSSFIQESIKPRMRFCLYALEGTLESPKAVSDL
jgi:hypothetical protein